MIIKKILEKYIKLIKGGVDPFILVPTTSEMESLLLGLNLQSYKMINEFPVKKSSSLEEQLKRIMQGDTIAMLEFFTKQNNILKEPIYTTFPTLE